MASYNVHVDERLLFAAIFPMALFLSYIKSLGRLAIASGFANILEVIGVSIVLQYLLRDLDNIDMTKRDKFRSIDQVALGFGSAMFAFEGISVVLPVYTRMKQPSRMSGCWGVINVSFAVLCFLYFMIGFFGFLKFGRDAGDSITLNLPSEPLYDAVRGLFTVAVFLTYPLQFYVPNEIIWNWAQGKLFGESREQVRADPSADATREEPGPVVSIIECDVDETATEKDEKPRDAESQKNGKSNHCDQTDSPGADQRDVLMNRYEYCCRTLIVIFTFVVAISVPKLNLLMDLIGSITGTILSLIFPALIHIAAFWQDTKGFSRVGMVLVDSLIIMIGVFAGICGSISSMMSIVKSYQD